MLLELRAVNDEAQLRTLTHEMRAMTARAQFAMAARKLAEEGKFPPLPEDASELELMEAATAFTLKEMRRRG